VFQNAGEGDAVIAQGCGLKLADGEDSQSIAAPNSSSATSAALRRSSLSTLLFQPFATSPLPI